ncbi:Disulfide bond formation protein C [Calidithermus terrae]|uniref:Disulfide bond formation protein C n=1 Tax=Calidithermus terrae TaxID=1408545 RepID=A0A399EZV6_9DEIN|nr:disulfide bond formation protein B [Calidithermus terrae]RIH90064.1 Disulfide bond formation protein C [Calidithermus terrae]
MEPAKNKAAAVDWGYLLLALAWLVAIVATLGSLYYSEVRKFVPCTLCWYQRIAMYPLVFILGTALWRGDLKVKHYVLPLSLIGGSISVVHLLEQRGLLDTSAVCSSIVPCSVEYIPSFPIPLQALIAFVLISGAMFLIRPKQG